MKSVNWALSADGHVPCPHLIQSYSVPCVTKWSINIYRNRSLVLGENILVRKMSLSAWVQSGMVWWIWIANGPEFKYRTQHFTSLQDNHGKDTARERSVSFPLKRRFTLQGLFQTRWWPRWVSVEKSPLYLLVFLWGMIWQNWRSVISTKSRKSGEPLWFTVVIPMDPLPVESPFALFFIANILQFL